MIRSSKHSLKDCNKAKIITIEFFISCYKEMLKKYVNILWNDYQNNPMSLLPSAICNRISTGKDFDSRIRQCAAKQACGIVNGTLCKRRKQLYKLKQLQKEGKDTKYLQRKIDCFHPSKPSVKNVNPEIDTRFVDILETGGHFDLFIRLSQLGDRTEVRIPVNHHKVSIKWLSKGALKNAIRLNKKYITLIYEIPDTPKKTKGVITGADQGELTTLTLGPNGNSQITVKNKDGYDLNTVCEILAGRVKGSKGFRRAQAHRTNIINWALNRFVWKNIMQVNYERIRDFKKGRHTSRELSHWTYPAIKEKVISLSEVEGFKFTEQDNKFRSQRCSKCGWVHKSNRKGKTFKCTNAICGFVADADLNAASNHETELYDISYHRVWYERINRTTGFFWLKDGVYTSDGEPIVSHTQKE